MLRVGDWIYVPKYNAEGTVIEIALTTISLEAFDKTTVTVPNYSLITDSFVNYRVCKILVVEELSVLSILI